MFCPIMQAVKYTTSLEKGSRNLLLECSLLVGDKKR